MQAIYYSHSNFPNRILLKNAVSGGSVVMRTDTDLPDVPLAQLARDLDNGVPTICLLEVNLGKKGQHSFPFQMFNFSKYPHCLFIFYSANDDILKSWNLILGTGHRNCLTGIKGPGLTNVLKEAARQLNSAAKMTAGHFAI